MWNNIIKSFSIQEIVNTISREDFNAFLNKFLSTTNIDKMNNLLNILHDIDSKGYKFILSNVIKHKEREHTLLINWVNKNKFSICEIGISGWRYSKKEVLIFNY